VDAFLGRLEQLVRAGSLVAMLRRCHRPCQRLLRFEDFYQDVLLQAVRHHASFRGQADAEIAAWLRAIGNQRMIDALRRSRKDKALPLPEQVPQREAEPEQDERTLWLLEVMKTLEPPDRDLLISRYWEKRSWDEIGRLMGLEPNTLAQRHLRLLRRLRALARSHFLLEGVS
jgi:RNA polymerase sigma factor (sigma-70 family)